jgi:ATP-dependent Lhr-like helicase
VSVAEDPVLYVERGGRGLLTLVGQQATGSEQVRDIAPSSGLEQDPLMLALGALADAVRTGRVGRLALERIDGEAAIASPLAKTLVELGFHTAPRRLTLSA